MSHEIPHLLSIIGLRVSRKSILGPASSKIPFATIEESSILAVSVINDDLDFSKIEAGYYALI